MKNTITLIAATIIFLFVVSFTLQNSADIPLKILFWESQGSLAMMIALTFTSGILVAILALLPKIIRLRHELRETNKKYSLLQKQSIQKSTNKN
ncbi:MAG: LapA family protein [Flavobacteriales bacterium]|nr:LapA family protein [Flavobacteriales bacterium]